MTHDEALQILALPPDFTRQDVDQALARIRMKYTAQAQLATDPAMRDQAHQALALAHEAYRLLTNEAPPNRIAPGSTSANPQRETIPTRRLEQTGSSERYSSRYPKPSTTTPPPAGWREKLAAAVICVALLTLGILLLI